MLVFFSMRSSGKKSLYSKSEALQPDFGSFGEIETEETSSENEINEPESTQSTDKKDTNSDDTENNSSENVAEETTKAAVSETGSTASDNSGYVYQSGDVSFNGHVTATFTSFSPVAVVVNPVITAPSTGFNTAYFVAAAMVIALAGAAFCARRGYKAE